MTPRRDLNLLLQLGLAAALENALRLAEQAATAAQIGSAWQGTVHQLKSRSAFEEFEMFFRISADYRRTGIILHFNTTVKGRAVKIDFNG